MLEGTKWIKKQNADFDVTMGGYDGAEVCELIGLFLMSKVGNIRGFNGGIYRDDWLGVTTLLKRQIEHNLKKKLINIFEKYDLKIIETFTFKIITIDI